MLYRRLMRGEALEARELAVGRENEAQQWVAGLIIRPFGSPIV